MKALEKQKYQLDEINTLIDNMSSEIELLRSLVFRYYIQHGAIIYSGEIHPPDNESFYFNVSGDLACCMLYNSDTTKIKSNYEIIKDKLKELDK